MHKVKPDLEPKDALIIIPTFQRSAALRNVLNSVMSQLRTRHNVSILVVDNNPLPQEKAFIAKYQPSARFPVHYLHVPESGVSHARNAGLAWAKTRYVAFLDDDMEITPDWLDSLMRVSILYGTAVVFGPIQARFPETHKALEPHIASFYSRYGKPNYEGEIATIYGTGASLLDMGQIKPLDVTFDSAHNQSGGEDDAYFAQLEAKGLKFGWSYNANSYEIVPEHRLTTNYIFRRNFGYGQAPSRTAIAKGGQGLINLIRHMTVGLAQFCVFGPLYLFMRLLKRPKANKFLGLCARGLGKIFWMDRFRPKLYGAVGTTAR